MNTALITLLAALAVTADPPGAPPQTKAEAAAEADAIKASDARQVPPGRPEDVALWEKGHAAGMLLRGARDRSTRLQQRVKYPGTDQKLLAISKESGEHGAKAKAAYARLVQTWQANVEMVKSDWPIDPIRVCSYEVLDFEAQLFTLQSNLTGRQVAPVRRNLELCLQKADGVQRAIDRVNQEFEAAIAEAERLTGAKPARGAEERHEEHEHRERRPEREEKGQ